MKTFAHCIKLTRLSKQTCLSKLTRLGSLALSVVLSSAMPSVLMADMTVGAGQTETFTSAGYATGTITLQGGTIVKNYSGEAIGSSDVTNPISVVADTVSTINSSSDASKGSWVFSGNITGSGSITQTGGNQLHLAGNNSGFSGTLKTTGGWLSFRNAGAGSENAVFDIQSSGIVFCPQNNTDAFQLGMLTGKGEVRSSTGNLGSGVNKLTIQVGGNDSSTLSGSFGGQIKDQGAVVANVVKSGQGTWTLTAGQAYTGATTIESGTLQLKGGLNAKSLVTVGSNATLDLAVGNVLGNNVAIPTIIVNKDGTVLSSVAGGHVNLAEVTLNGGKLYSTVNPSSYGNFLLAGRITVTDDSTIDCQRVLVRDVPNGVASAGQFAIAQGKVLTVKAAVNTGEVNNVRSEIFISGIDGQPGGTFSFTTGAAFGYSSKDAGAKTLPTITITNATLNNGSPDRTNVGQLVLNDARLTSVDASGNDITISNYGNFLIADKITVTGDSSIDAGKIFIRGTAYSNVEPGVFDISPAAKLTINSPIAFTGTDTQNENGNVIVNGGGTLVINSFAEGYDAAKNKVQVNNGTIQFGTGGTVGSLALTMTLESQGVFATNRSSIGTYTFPITSNGGTITNLSPVKITFGGAVESVSGLTLTGSSDAGNENVGRIVFNAGMLKGSGEVVKDGGNKVVMVGDNTGFSGNVSLNDGIMEIRSNQGLGSGIITLNGGTLMDNKQDAPLTLANAITVADGESTVFTPVQYMILSGNISGTGNFTKTGSSQLHFSGDNSNFSGSFTSTESWVNFKSAEAASENARYVLTNKASGFVFVPTTENDVFTFGNLTSDLPTASIRMGADANKAGIINLNLQVGANNESGTFAGVFANNKDANATVTSIVNVEKVGTGTWTLTGASTTTGTMTVSGGTLELLGSIGGDLKVNNGGALAGTGTIAGNLTIADDGIFTIDLTNALTYEKLVTNQEPMTVVGNVDFTSAAIKLIATDALLDGLGEQQLVYVKAEGNSSFADNSLLLEGISSDVLYGMTTDGSFWVSASAAGGGGGGVEQGVPEPAAWLLLTTALIIGLPVIRRRIRK